MFEGHWSHFLLGGPPFNYIVLDIIKIDQIDIIIRINHIRKHSDKADLPGDGPILEGV